MDGMIAMGVDGKSRPTITVAILTRNEEATLQQVVEELATTLRARDLSYELLILNDASCDQSASIAENICGRSPDVRVLNIEENNGLGTAYYLGLKEARGDWITFFPADGQYPPEALEALLSRRHAADLVLGQSSREYISAINRLISVSHSRIYSMLFPGAPQFHGVFLARTELRDLVTMKARGKDFSLVFEMIFASGRAGRTIVSTPVLVRPRTAGRSKALSWGTVCANFLGMLRVRLHLARRVR